MLTLMYSNWPPTAAHISRLERMVGSGRVVVVGDEAGAVRVAPHTSIIFGHRYLRQVLPLARGLRWVQSSAGGVDSLPLDGLRRQGVTLSRNPGNVEAIATHGLAMILSLVRRLPEAWRAQSQGIWSQPFDMLDLPDTVLVIGMGGVGMALSRRFRALGMRVIGCARQGRPEQLAACDVFVQPSGWQALLPGCDAVVLAVPLDECTRGLLGPRQIESLPPHALIVNLARGGVVDMTAVADALRAGRLGGVATDVLDEVPPPSDPIWRLPGLLITPKVSAYHPAMQNAFERFVEAQLQRYLAAESLDAVVDLARV